MWNQLQKALSKKEITIYELAKKSGLNENTIRNIKTGQSVNPSFKTMEKIADVLDVSLDIFRKERIDE